ncbi:glycosyltransferase family 2 protein [Agrobacterium tumefaciens]|uniref:glycosyltransferase family 2 protein n=1 Tax=Agrobacterium tumefaciens TaxID=358 RepID=UPI002350D130|nr:glycosyltransferase family 2 protein [Agrobacterium tumefaciens]
MHAEATTECIFDLSRYSLSDVTIISVCYRSDDEIGRMVSTVPLEVPIVLVDNGGTNDFTQLPDNRSLKVVPLIENEGFGKGCNAGAKLANTPFLFFLNPDTRLKEGAIEALLEAAESYPDGAAFNPRIVNRDGGAYFKRRSYLLPRSASMKRGWPDKDCKVPILSGAALFVSKANFETVQGFDPHIFLYHEDDDLSLRLQKLGSLFYVRNSLVEHASGHSTARSPEVAYFKAFHMAQSRIYTGLKYCRPAPILTTLLAGVMLLLSPHSFFSPRRRAKAFGLIKGTREMSRELRGRGL